jgi:glucan phosphoethanolaminetransferase (alkaline phosphatase superfamily)
MYTYESFVTDGVFTLLRPVVYSFLLIAVAIFIIVLLPKAFQRFMNGFTIISISIISIIISGQVLFFDAIIADELGLGGDGASTLIFLAIAGLSVASPVIFYIRKGES